MLVLCTSLSIEDAPSLLALQGGCKRAMTNGLVMVTRLGSYSARGLLTAIVGPASSTRHKHSSVK